MALNCCDVPCPWSLFEHPPASFQQGGNIKLHREDIIVPEIQSSNCHIHSAVTKASRMSQPYCPWQEPEVGANYIYILNLLTLKPTSNSCISPWLWYPIVHILSLLNHCECVGGWCSLSRNAPSRMAGRRLPTATTHRPAGVVARRYDINNNRASVGFLPRNLAGAGLSVVGLFREAGHDGGGSARGRGRTGRRIREGRVREGAQQDGVLVLEGCGSELIRRLPVKVSQQ